MLSITSNDHAGSWYARNFGLVYKEKHRPIDYRVTKCIESGKEMIYDLGGVSNRIQFMLAVEETIGDFERIGSGQLTPWYVNTNHKKLKGVFEI